MTPFIQRHHECALASLCWLTDTDYETASDLFKLENPLPWGGVTSIEGADKWWVPFIRKWFNLPVGIEFFSTANDKDAYIPSGNDNGLLLMKRYGSHGAALKDGMVFDPEYGTVEPLNDYVTQREADGWTICGVRRVS